MNRDYIIGGNVSVNNFYGFLGLADMEGGDELEWCMDTGIYWIDFNHRKTILDDGLEVCVIEWYLNPSRLHWTNLFTQKNTQYYEKL